jgi:phosphate transport system substrate-binding protein
VQGIEKDLYGIGYSGIGYKTSGVKALALAAKPGEPYLNDEFENVLAGKYPLSRFLYVYVNRKPGEPLDPTTKQFLAYALSRSGQEVVIKDGYLPMTAKMVAEELKKLD